jgi:hypothetical protein
MSDTIECKNPDDKINFAVNIIIHVFILFCFLSVFFVMYITKIAKKSFDKEISHPIEDGLGEQFRKIKPDNKEKIKNVTKYLNFDNLINYYSEPTKDYTTNNKWLNVVIVMINVFMVILIIAAYLFVKKSCNQCVPIGSIIGENLIIFGFIGLVEFMFFKYIAIKYIPVQPSVLVKSAIDALKKHVR